ncbi:MAG TPA: hypothetical protein VI583_01960 [Cyclobacteriaceae bacterium]|nr:hypothetical protein [Cyclobacteriaceae bacterium]
MDDYQVIIYIILVVIYIISRALKARKKIDPTILPPQQRYEENESYPETAPKPFDAPSKPRQLSFEDLLKEFSGYEEKEVHPAPAESETANYPYKTETKPETRQYQSYESPENFPSYNDEEGKSLESLVSYEDMYQSPGRVEKADTKHADINEIRFKEYASYQAFDIHKARRFRKLLHNSTSMKDAVVLKEILDRKYF